MTKPPINPHTGSYGDSSNPQKWGTYEQAVQRANTQGNIEGIGFTFSDNDEISGIDLDGCRDPETGELDPWAAEVVALKESYAEVSPSGAGIHFFVEGKLPAAVVSKPAGVEMYSTGRYFTVTGDHVRGTPNEIRPAPKTIAALKARVEQWRSEAKQAGQPPTNEPSQFFRSVNDAALKDIAAWVHALFPSARFQPGTNAYRVRSKALGRDLEEDLSIAPNGIKDFGVHDMGDCRSGRRTAIDLVVQFGNQPDPTKAALWLCEKLGRTPAYFGWRDDAERQKIGAEAARTILKEKDGSIIDAETGEDLTPKKSSLGSILDNLALGRGSDWTRPEGVLAELADWILRSSRRPNRPLAVAAATAALSALCGRHLYAPTGTALNVYIVCLANTGVGKNRPYSAVSEIFRAAKLDNLQTTIKGFSVSAIENMIVSSPVCVATADEIGASLLSKMSHQKANTHEVAMRGALMELWSREQGMGPFMTHRRAQSDAVQVPNPSLSLFGMSTSEAFYESITQGSVKDGFLNRFLLAHAAPRSKVQEVAEEDRQLPAAIVQKLVSLIPNPQGNLAQALGIFGLNVDVPGERLGWDHPETRIAAEEFEEEVLDLADANPQCAPLMARIFEYSIRLASLHAISREGRRACVTLADLKWGAAWALESAKTMLDGSAAMMAATDYEQRFNLIRNAIEEAGVITKEKLARDVRRVNAREREEVIKHLIEGGWIAEDRLRKTTKPVTCYRWVG